MEAAARGNAPLCKLLLARHADVHRTVPAQQQGGMYTGYEEGQTALHRAVSTPQWPPGGDGGSCRTDEVVRLLIAAGADPCAATTITKTTPLAAAAEHNLSGAVRIIGEAIRQQRRGGRESCLGEIFSAALAAACRKGCADAVTALFDFGAVPTAEVVKAALQDVICGAGEVRDPACLQLIFARGGQAAVEAMNSISDLFLQTHSNPCMKILLDHGADPLQKVLFSEMHALEYLQSCRSRDVKNLTALKKAVAASQQPTKVARR